MTSPTAFETMSEQERRSRPVGTGPFKLLEWVPNDHITLVRNEHYWKKELPYLDKVTFKVLNDPISQVTALKSWRGRHAELHVARVDPGAAAEQKRYVSWGACRRPRWRRCCR